MKECDSLASRITMTAQRDQVVQDMLRRTTTNSGLQSSFPLPLVTAVRFICRVGHCYGYALDSPADRRFVAAPFSGSRASEGSPASDARDVVEPTLHVRPPRGLFPRAVATAVLEPESTGSRREPRFDVRSAVSSISPF